MIIMQRTNRYLYSQSKITKKSYLHRIIMKSVKMKSMTISEEISRTLLTATVGKETLLQKTILEEISRTLQKER